MRKEAVKTAAKTFKPDNWKMASTIAPPLDGKPITELFGGSHMRLVTYDVTCKRWFTDKGHACQPPRMWRFAAP